ncbi:MAG: hypothetical protein R2911_16430 [Caldilineaceae bacterium]
MADPLLKARSLHQLQQVAPLLISEHQRFDKALQMQHHLQLFHALQRNIDDLRLHRPPVQIGRCSR